VSWGCCLAKQPNVICTASCCCRNWWYAWWCAHACMCVSTQCSSLDCMQWARAASGRPAKLSMAGDGRLGPECATVGPPSIARSTRAWGIYSPMCMPIQSLTEPGRLWVGHCSHCDRGLQAVGCTAHPDAQHVSTTPRMAFAAVQLRC
jgi:hypothetical protein